MNYRRHIRHDTDIPIIFETDIMIGHHTCCLINVGQGGLCFKAPAPIKIGTYLKICIPGPEKQFSLNGTISRCYWDREGIYHLGVEFKVSLSDSFLSSIDTIEQYKKLNILNTGKFITGEDAILKMSHEHLDQTHLKSVC